MSFHLLYLSIPKCITPYNTLAHVQTGYGVKTLWDTETWEEKCWAISEKKIGLLPSVLLTYTSLQHSDLHPNYILVWAPYCYMRCSRGSCPYVLRLAWSPLWVWSQPVTPTPDMQQLKWRHNTEYYINTTMHHLLYWTPNRWPISCPPNHDQYLLFFT